jgi:hypothetical protein
MKALLELSERKAKELKCRERPQEYNCRTLVLESLFEPKVSVKDLSILAKPQEPGKDEKDPGKDDKDDKDDKDPEGPEFSYTLQTMSHLEAKAALAYLKKQGLTLGEVKVVLGPSNYAHATTRSFGLPGDLKIREDRLRQRRLGAQYEGIRYSRYAERPYQRYIMSRARIGVSDVDTDYVEASRFRQTEIELENLRQQRVTNTRVPEVTSRTARSLISSEAPAVTSTTDTPIDAGEAAEFQEAVDETFPQSDEPPVEGVEDSAAVDAAAEEAAQAAEEAAQAAEEAAQAAADASAQAAEEAAQAAAEEAAQAAEEAAQAAADASAQAAADASARAAADAARSAAADAAEAAAQQAATQAAENAAAARAQQAAAEAQRVAARSAAASQTTAARTALNDAFSKLQTDMQAAAEINSDGAEALQNLSSAKDSSARAAASRTVRGIALELGEATEVAQISQDAYFSAANTYTAALQQSNSISSTQLAPSQQELINWNTAKTMKGSLADMVYSVDNIEGLVSYYSGLSESAQAERLAAAEMAYTEAYNALGEDVVVPESVKLNVMQNGGDMTQALRDWMTGELSAIEAPVTAASTTTNASYSLFSDQMNKVDAAESASADLLDKLSDTTLTESQLTSLHSQINNAASNLTSELSTARRLHASYLTAVAEQDTVMAEQTTLRQALQPNSPAFESTTVQGANLQQATEYFDSLSTYQESLSSLDETVGLLDAARGSAIADALVAQTNASAQASLDSMRNAIDAADAKLAQLEREAQSVLIDLESAVFKINTNDVALPEAVEADMAAAQTAQTAYDEAVLKYKTQFNLLNESVTNYNNSNSFNILEQNGQAPTKLLQPSSDFLDATKVIQRVQTQTLTMKIDQWSENQLEAAASFRSNQLATLRSAYTNANTAYLQARANLQGTVDAINSDTFSSLEESAKIDLFRMQKEQLAKQASTLATRDTARSNWLTEANTVSDHMTSVQESVDLSRSSMGRAALENTEFATTQSRIATEIQTVNRLQGISATGVTAQTTSAFRNFTLSASNLAASNIGATARSMSAGVRVLLTMKNSADALGEAALSGVTRVGLNSIYAMRGMAAGAMGSAAESVESLPFAGRVLAAPIRLLSSAGGMLASGLMRAAGPLGAAAAVGLSAWSVTNTLINAFKSKPTNYSYSFSQNTQDNMVAPLPAGVSHDSPMRDRGHDSYDSQDTTSFTNYFRFYTSPDRSAAIRNALQAGFNADQLYDSGHMTTFHQEHSWSFMEIVSLFPAWGLITSLPVILNHQLEQHAAPTNFKAAFSLFYGALQTRYNEAIANGDTPEDAAQNAVEYGHAITDGVDAGRSLNIGVDDGQFFVQTGFNEEDTAQFLAAYEQDPYVFWGMDQSTLERMGLNGEMAYNSHFLTTHDDTWNNMTQSNPYFASAQLAMETSYKETLANATVDSFEVLVSNVPTEDPAYGYLLQQLNALKQDPSISSNLSTQNKKLVDVPPDVDASLAVVSPYFFSVNAAWQAQTTIYRNISSFQQELPDWFSFNTIAPVEGLSSKGNQELAQAATLMQQLGAYDYNLTNSEGYHPETGQIFRSERFEVGSLSSLLDKLQAIPVGDKSTGDTVVDDVLIAYERQYTREKAADAWTAALSTVISKVQLAQAEGRSLSVLSVSNPDYSLSRGSMIQDLNETQSSHYVALYNQDNTRWVGYDKVELAHLGLNTDLSDGALAEDASVLNENSDAPVQETVDKFANALEDQAATASVIAPQENVDTS